MKRRNASARAVPLIANGQIRPCTPGTKSKMPRLRLVFDQSPVAARGDAID